MSDAAPSHDSAAPNQGSLSVAAHDAQPSHPPARQIGHACSHDGHYTRVVERITVLHEPLDFRTLCKRVLSPKTRYLLLDLDRTTHRNRNLGELLGWEVAAYRVHGERSLAALEPNIGRFFWDARAPLKFARYWNEGIRTWTFPGLSYLLWGKLAAQVPVLERWSYRKFGPEPMQAVQRIPQTALLHKLSTLPEATLHMLARRVWQRLVPDQVITREDIAWLRQQCPEIRVIITSASPKPMLDVAAEELGVDAVEFTTSGAYQAGFAAPYWVDRRFALGSLAHIAAPDEVHLNSGHNKIERLRARYPELADANVESVGISDTGYGEDHSWAQYLTVVVDINSSAPFPPVVAFDAPLREIYSAQLQTNAERTDGAQSSAAGAATSWSSTQLRELLADQIEQLEQLARRHHQLSQTKRAELSNITRELAATRVAIGESVARYNQASDERRAPALAELRVLLRREAGALARLARAQLPFSTLRMHMARLLRASRARLTQLQPDAAPLRTASR